MEKQVCWKVIFDAQPKHFQSISLTFAYPGLD